MRQDAAKSVPHMGATKYEVEIASMGNIDSGSCPCCVSTYALLSSTLCSGYFSWMRPLKGCRFTTGPPGMVRFRVHPHMRLRGAHSSSESFDIDTVLSINPDCPISDNQRAQTQTLCVFKVLPMCSTVKAPNKAWHMHIVKNTCHQGRPGGALKAHGGNCNRKDQALRLGFLRQLSLGHDSRVQGRLSV